MVHFIYSYSGATSTKSASCLEPLSFLLTYHKHIHGIIKQLSIHTLYPTLIVSASHFVVIIISVIDSERRWCVVFFFLMHGKYVL